MHASLAARVWVVALDRFASLLHSSLAPRPSACLHRPAHHHPAQRSTRRRHTSRRHRHQRNATLTSSQQQHSSSFASVSAATAALSSSAASLFHALADLIAGVAPVSSCASRLHAIACLHACCGLVISRLLLLLFVVVRCLTPAVCRSQVYRIGGADANRTAIAAKAYNEVAAIIALPMSVHKQRNATEESCKRECAGTDVRVYACCARGWLASITLVVRHLHLGSAPFVTSVVLLTSVILVSLAFDYFIAKELTLGSPWPSSRIDSDSDRTRRRERQTQLRNVLDKKAGAAALRLTTPPPRQLALPTPAAASSSDQAEVSAWRMRGHVRSVFLAASSMAVLWCFPFGLRPFDELDNDIQTMTLLCMERDASTIDSLPRTHGYTQGALTIGQQMQCTPARCDAMR